MRMSSNLVALLAVVVVAISGCATAVPETDRPSAGGTQMGATPSPAPTTEMPTSTPNPAPATQVPPEEPSPPPATEMPVDASCALQPIVVPTPPADVPGYTQLDPDTNLHMTGTPQEIDLASYRLKVTGNVENPLSLTLDQLRCMPKVETKATLECPGFFVDVATWAGTPLREVLALAGVPEDATKIRLISADGYSRSVRLTSSVLETGFLAYEWEGEPVPIMHGFPVRVVLPEEFGGVWVKWLTEIEVMS